MYDDKGQLEESYLFQNLSETDAAIQSYFYKYEADGRLKRVEITSTASTYSQFIAAGTEEYEYDVYDRVQTQTNSFRPYASGSTGFTNEIGYTYKTYSDRTSSWVATYTSTVNDGTALTYTYTYDQNGNITKIVYSTGQEIRYVYDDIGQLIREDNGLKNYTYVYTYDNAGNITSKNAYSLTAAGTTPTSLSSSYNYNYSSSTWGDMLTSYRGVSITYDAIGNPLSYYNGSSYNFTWTGRQLTGATKGGITYSFTYNDEGIRTSKTKGNVTTTYYLEGSRIVAEKTDKNVTVYIYDSEGLPIGMQYHGESYGTDVWDTYWFERNLQGDVVAVYNQAGTKLVEYKYDAWGNCTSTYYNSGSSTTATKNPFRYRGYYYDNDLKLYYLNTRYYDANTGRFISPDTESVITATPNALTDKNLYAYCDNNPVMRRDDGGQLWDTLFDVVSLAFSVADVVATPANPWAWAGLVGDVVDLIPFVSGVGEATDLLRVATKADEFVDAVDNANDASKAIDNAIDSYKALKKANQGKGLEVHHIVEKRFAKDLDIANTNDMLSIALTKADHRVYTNAWRKEFAYGTKGHSPQKIWEAAKRIYIDRPDLLEAARKTIFR